jgi:hypothetical protein
MNGLEKYIPKISDEILKTAKEIAAVEISFSESANSETVTIPMGILNHDEIKKWAFEIADMQDQAKRRKALAENLIPMVSMVASAQLLSLDIQRLHRELESLTRMVRSQQSRGFQPPENLN